MISASLIFALLLAPSCSDAKKERALAIERIRTGANRYFNRSDTNKDGSLTFTEFHIIIPSDVPIKVQEENIRISFDIFDLNHDDRITQKEFEDAQIAGFDEHQRKSALK